MEPEWNPWVELLLFINGPFVELIFQNVILLQSGRVSAEIAYEIVHLEVISLFHKLTHPSPGSPLMLDNALSAFSMAAVEADARSNAVLACEMEPRLEYVRLLLGYASGVPFAIDELGSHRFFHQAELDDMLRSTNSRPSCSPAVKAPLYF